MEEYLTTDELCDRIKYQKQTIYNLIHRKVFVAGKHFLKPTPKKILFKWSEIRAWIGDAVPQDAKDIPELDARSDIGRQPENVARGGTVSLIRI